MQNSRPHECPHDNDNVHTYHRVTRSAFQFPSVYLKAKRNKASRAFDATPYHPRIDALRYF